MALSSSNIKLHHKIFVSEKGTYIAHEKDDVLGRGTYGVVYRARFKTDPTIQKAIKVFSPDTMDESEGIPSTTLREINALKSIVHPNVMTAEEVVIPDSQSPIDMFFIMELCQGTLKDRLIELIRKYLHNDPIWLNPPKDLKLPDQYIKEVKKIAWELLNALAVVHSRGVMHRDLKPVNILWGFDHLLKLADFGLARFIRGNQNSENNVLQQTGEVQTMWYRAPEVLLGDEKYGLLVDDWSLGCVLAELFRFRRNSTGRIEPAPLFQGRSDVGTLMIIFETLGTPQPKKNKVHEYLGKLRYWNEGYPNWVNGTLQTRIPLLDSLGHNLLEQLLRLSPSERRAARFLLNHPWFDDIKHELNSFVPWYRGFEEDYKRLIAVDRLPFPRTLKEAKLASQHIKSNTQMTQSGNQSTQSENQPIKSENQPIKSETGVQNNYIAEKQSNHRLEQCSKRTLKQKQEILDKIHKKEHSNEHLISKQEMKDDDSVNADDYDSKQNSPKCVLLGTTMEHRISSQMSDDIAQEQQQTFLQKQQLCRSTNQQYKILENTVQTKKQGMLRSVTNFQTNKKNVTQGLANTRSRSSPRLFAKTRSSQIKQSMQQSPRQQQIVSFLPDAPNNSLNENHAKNNQKLNQRVLRRTGPRTRSLAIAEAAAIAEKK